MKITIAKHGWTQIGGDMNPGTYGGIIAKADGDHIILRVIQPLRDNIGDNEAAEVGYPFWSKDGWYDLDDLNPAREDVQSAMDALGMTMADLEELRPESRAMAIASALIETGYGSDEGPSGWAKDVIPGPVKWWGSKRPAGWRYLEDEDRDFRRLLREQR